MSVSYSRYFEHRQVTEADYADHGIPHYLVPVLPSDRQARILDIGCGFGQLLGALRAAGYTDAQGIDIGPEAVASCRARGLEVEMVEGIEQYAARGPAPFDFVGMSHVLEHIPKAQVISTLELIRTRLLAPGGALFIAVPNGQSHTGGYWMYEDFTHETLYTAGSLLFVLRSAGFTQVEFVDPESLAGQLPLTAFVKRLFLRYYRWRLRFWNKVTGSAFHAPSPIIFSFEVKAVARALPKA